MTTPSILGLRLLPLLLAPTLVSSCRREENQSQDLRRGLQRTVYLNVVDGAEVLDWPPPATTTTTDTSSATAGDIGGEPLPDLGSTAPTTTDTGSTEDSATSTSTDESSADNDTTEDNAGLETDGASNDDSHNTDATADGSTSSGTDSSGSTDASASEGGVSLPEASDTAAAGTATESATETASDTSEAGDMIADEGSTETLPPPAPVPTPAPTPEPAPAPSEGDEVINGAELAQCAKRLGVGKERIMVVGNRTALSLKTDQYVAIKLAGRQTSLDLVVTGALGLKVPGICVFVTGHEATANIFLGLDVGKLVYIGRGDESQCQVQVSENTVLSELSTDLAGNQAGFKIGGAGSFACGEVRQKGHKPSFQCGH